MHALTYAKALLARIASTDYGQSGKPIPSDGLTDRQVTAICGVMMHSMALATAQKEGDTALSEYHIGQVDWRINRGVNVCGLDVAELRQVAEMAHGHVMNGVVK